MERQFKEQKKVGVYYYRFKNGENGADVHDRMSIFLQFLFRRILAIDYFKWDNIIIVSHALTIKFFIMAFRNLPVSQFDNIKQLDNGQYLIIEKNSIGNYILNDDDIFINKNE